MIISGNNLWTFLFLREKHIYTSTASINLKRKDKCCSCLLMNGQIAMTEMGDTVIPDIKQYNWNKTWLCQVYCCIYSLLKWNWFILYAFVKCFNFRCFLGDVGRPNKILFITFWVTNFQFDLNIYILLYLQWELNIESKLWTFMSWQSLTKMWYWDKWW